jgi:16S rRNA (cytosine1402-N4)-methyltransferase
LTLASTSPLHRPVMLREVLEQVFTSPHGIYLDGTIGTGGHSEAICKRMSPQGLLIGLDRDEEAIRISRERLLPLRRRVHLVKESYGFLDRVLGDLGIEEVNAALLDLGMSTYQLEGSGRGFSFSRDEPLDMRMDLDEKVTARELVNNLPAKALEEILWAYGEEKQAKAISRMIEKERAKAPIVSSLRLASLVASVVRRSHRSGGRHPATRTFQALRIAVNRELDTLRAFLGKIPFFLGKGGRLVVLTYHSLEDRLVKQAMVEWEGGCLCPPDLPECRCERVPLLRRVHKKGIKPTHNEKEDNPRARSAILRTAERI